MLPLTLPGLVTATIFTFIAAWNEYVVALTLMQDDAKKPLTVGISSYVTGYEQNWDQLFAASLIAIVPVVILFAAHREAPRRRAHRRLGQVTAPDRRTWSRRAVERAARPARRARPAQRDPGGGVARLSPRRPCVATSPTSPPSSW